MTASLLLADALATGGRADVLIENGRISRIAPPGTIAEPVARTIDLDGALLLPSFVEGHVHLDKTLLGTGWHPHRPGGTVLERIDAEKRLRRELGLPVGERGRRLAEQAVRFGTGRMRCHVDVDTEVGLAGVEELLELREALRPLLDVQLVAFPQSGILRDPGTAALLDAALAAGVEVIGGLDPAGIDGDVAAHLDVVFALAEKYGVPVDVHLHDPGELGAFELREIARRSEALGLHGRVTVSHAYALGQVNAPTFGATAAALARGGVAIMTTAPGSSALPPIRRLLAEGVAVFTGNDNIRDAWSPLGNGDPLERAGVVAYRHGFATDEELGLALSLVGERAARATGLDKGYGVHEGAAADLVALRAGSVAEAVAERPPRALVLKSGRAVARDGALEPAGS